MKKNKFLVVVLIVVSIFLVQPKMLNRVLTIFSSQSIANQLGIEDHDTTDNQLNDGDVLADLKKMVYDGSTQVIQVNGGQPNFDETDLSLENGSWEKYSSLDMLNRVGQANALLGIDLMPTEERESIQHIKPTGWHNKKIQFNEKSDYLYNRSHLIGFQLTGQNANPQNLFTGTRALNANFQKEEDSMVYYENLVALYIRETNHHVRYQVTPVFKGMELVCRGVWMQAQSIEDGNLSFSIFIFNIQPGYEIDYLTGLSNVNQ